MKNRMQSAGCFILFFAAFSFSPLEAQTPLESGAPAAGAPSYNLLISTSRKALESGEVKDAFVAAMAAIATDDKRFEAYALAATIKMRQGDFSEAGRLLIEAQTRAPAEKQ